MAEQDRILRPLIIISETAVRLFKHLLPGSRLRLMRPSWFDHLQFNKVLSKATLAGMAAAPPPSGQTEAKMAGGNAAIISKIGCQTIKGTATGGVGGSDFYGIVAENVGTVMISGKKVATTAGIGNDDFKINEL